MTGHDHLHGPDPVDGESGDRSSDRDDPLGTDGALDLLSKPNRRAIVRLLADEPALPADVEALATRLRTGTHGDAEHDRLLARLHHVDLPKLDDAGLVEYDPRTGRVAAGDPDRIDRLSSTLPPAGDR